mgnify:CR=1 FL=1
MNLHREAVSDQLWELLNLLMKDVALHDFALVGGTALALYYGHRKSVDIDLFITSAFDAPALAEHLKNTYKLKQSEVLRNTVRGIANGIKLECISHQYPLLNPQEIRQNLRVYSASDLAALKGNAIANRGAKIFFWDIHRLLKEFTIEEILKFCEKKYEADSIWNIEKSLMYFEDAEDDPDPIDLQGISWSQVKSDLVAAFK